MRWIAEKVGGAPRLAELTGISEATIYRYMGGETEMKLSQLVQIATAGGVLVEWLATGEGPRTKADMPFAGAPTTRLTAAEGMKNLSAEQLREIYAVPMLGAIGTEKGGAQRTKGYVDGEYVYVPMFDVRAGAGRGKYPIGERIIAWPVFMFSFIRDKVKALPEDLCVITVQGDSMEPELPDGSAVLVDLGDRGPRRDGIYVLRMDEVVYVKHLQRLPGGIIKVSSASPRYEPFNLHMRQLEQQRAAILGRVAWGDRVF